jgi:hypothetical protein
LRIESRSCCRISSPSGQHVEGVKLDFVIVLAGMQGVETGDAVDAKNDGFAIYDELLHPVLESEAIHRSTHVFDDALATARLPHTIV